MARVPTMQSLSHDDLQLLTDDMAALLKNHLSGTYWSFDGTAQEKRTACQMAEDLSHLLEDRIVNFQLKNFRNIVDADWCDWED